MIWNLSQSSARPLQQKDTNSANRIDDSNHYSKIMDKMRANFETIGEAASNDLSTIKQLLVDYPDPEDESKQLDINILKSLAG